MSRLHARVTIERKIIINGVEFEDITLNQLDHLIEEVRVEITTLQESYAELVDLHSEKAEANHG